MELIGFTFNLIRSFVTILGTGLTSPFAVAMFTVTGIALFGLALTVLQRLVRR